MIFVIKEPLFVLSGKFFKRIIIFFEDILEINFLFFVLFKGKNEEIK